MPTGASFQELKTILVLDKPISPNIHRIQANKDTVALLMHAGYNAISSVLSYMNILDFYRFIKQEDLINCAADMFKHCENVFLIDKCGIHGFEGAVLGKINQLGYKPNVYTKLFRIPNIPGYPGIKDIVRTGVFETIVTNGQYINKIYK